MRTVLAYNESHRRHYSPGHVERPERLDTLVNHLERLPLWRSLRRHACTPALLDHARLVHTEEHVSSVTEAIRREIGRIDADTYVTKDSLLVALDALGCVLGVTREVLDGRADSGLAAVRPPGHHATPTRSMGFCLFSNVAVAARWARREVGLERLLIVDFDVHHGNGTQDVFYEDPSVLVMNTHQYPFYPGTGALEERGEGAGEGTTVNVPLPAGTGDTAYARVFREILRPIALEYDPECIFLSAGYDAHWRDPLGGMRLTTTGFAELVREILDWAYRCCDGRLVATLEGGYDVEALARSAAGTLHCMIDPEAHVEDPIGPPPGADFDVEDHLKHVQSYLSAG